ncbi:MAG: glycosyltransferase family 2 protein [Candidatus Hydrogenedentes bacterium]|nr:glycosyltransferase family 2 protein [Candidatus Hydrogenedentota bacterium]
MGDAETQSSGSGSTPISVCIIAGNEEDSIGACLDSVSPIADEIVVVLDSRSTDRTSEICTGHGARVVRHDWLGHVRQKDYCVGLAKNDWVFCIDADERVSPELAACVNRLRNEGFSAAAYSVRRRNFYLGRWMRYGGWYPDRKVRLFDRRRARWGGINPHDHVIVDADARCDRLDFDLLHYTYRDLTHHTRVINSYATIAAQEKADRGSTRLVTFRLFTHPAAKFIKTYLLQGDFLAGTRGFIHAVQASYLVFLKYAKLWEKRDRHDRNE